MAVSRGETRGPNFQGVAHGHWEPSRRQREVIGWKDRPCSVERLELNPARHGRYVYGWDRELSVDGQGHLHEGADGWLLVASD
jgi:hypothetical protein